MSSNSDMTTGTEFVQSAFRTAVEDEDVEKFTNEIDEVISELRTRFERDGLLEDVLRRESAKNGIKSSFSETNQDPEPLTQEVVIEPLLRALGYGTWYRETGDKSDERGNVADYSVPLDDHDAVDSSQLLIEAEPINKPLESRGHGIDQVETWLSQREFETDFGFATDGIRWVVIRYDPDTYTHDRIEHVDLKEVFVSLFNNQTGKNKKPIEALSPTEKETLRALLQTFERQNFLSIAGDARQIIKETQQSITDDFYDTYIQTVFGVRQNDERSGRSLIGDGVIKPDEATGDDTRLFAVKIMNRLIFLKFLEDKHIVKEDLLREMEQTYDDGVYPDSLYKTFVERLFFDVMNKSPEKRPDGLSDIEMFEGIPYLNGGLFRPELGEDRDINERDFDVRDSVLKEVIHLLEQYEFSADGGPTDLDPSVLGNIFEKTINYLTTDPGDQNKALGAYYTPSEVTRFCAERTVRPALYDRLKPIAQEKLEWPEETFNRYDTVYSLIEALPADMEVIGPMLDEIDEFRVVDPAMGSGHFLTSVLEEIVAVRKALYAQNDNHPHEYRLKKTTVQKNIYGVDIVGPAVEIGKLRLWLSIISELTEEDTEEFATGELALPNIAFNLRQGNSLIGYIGFPEESGNGEYTLGKFTEQSVENRYEDIIDHIEAYEDAIGEIAEEHRQKALKQLKSARQELIPKIKRDFHDAGVKSITQAEVEEMDPFNWVVEYAEVYADGGFDVIVGNPPWDVLRTNRDDYFVRHDPSFRTRMPNDKDEKMEELLEDPDISEGWDQYNREMQARADYFNNSDEYELQSPVVDGKEVTSENELSALFLERAYKIARGDAQVSLILPNVIFTSSTAKDLRLHLLNNTTVDSLLHFENHGIFDDIDSRYRFGILTFRNSGQTDELRGIFLEQTTDVIDNFEQQTVKIPRKILTDYSPEAALFPQISSRGNTDPENEVGLLRKLLDHPALDKEIDGAWNVDIHRELDRTYDSDRFVESQDEGDYPVLGGKNIYQFVYDDSHLDVQSPEFWSVNEEKSTEKSAKSRIREKEVRNLKTALYNAFDGNGSQKQFVNDLLNDSRGEPLSEDDVLLDCTTPRIAFRDIGNTANERTFIATVLPEGVVCHSKLRVLRPYEIEATEADLEEEPLRSIYKRRFTNQEMFAALGLINSLPFDYLMRTKIDNTLVEYKVRESQVPRLTEGDDFFEYIWRRAARLNCYGDAFESLRVELGIAPDTTKAKRKQTQAELDAAAMHTYGLDRNEATHLLDNFGQVKSPRLMDDEYFEMVIQNYDSLSSD